MAILAPCALRTRMWIVLQMAGITPRPQGDLEDRVDMTGRAFDRCMRPMQFMIRVSVVIEYDERPLAAYMAGIAGTAEMSVVIVVLEVTGQTSGVELV